jgi:hypothetical protein
MIQTIISIMGITVQLGQHYINMKKFLLSIIIGIVSLVGFSRQVTISDATAFASLSIQSNDTVTIIGSYTRSTSWKASHISNVLITGDWHYTFTGTGKAMDFAYLRNCTVQNGEVTGTSTASSAFELWRSYGVTISLRLHGSQWGIRGFYDTNTVITNCEIYNTWDDNVYFGNYDRNIEVSYSYFDNPNTGYWTAGTGSSGDCFQTDGTQGFIYIHDNVFNHEQNGWKFAVILGQVTYSANDSAVIRDNVFNVRTWQMRATEDASTHTVNGTSCVYLKYMASVRMFNNTYNGGSNAIYPMGITTPCRLRVYNETFVNQTQCIYFGTNWDIRVTNCTFRNGRDSYLWGSGNGDLITKNVFYGLSNPHSGLSGSYSYTDNLENPETVTSGYGANYEINTNPIVETDTVTVYQTILLIPN